MFLSQVGYPNFELVIFTTENGMTFDPIVNGLDPELQHIMYRLYRDATRYVNGHHTKDLSAINRDLKKVIYIYRGDLNTDHLKTVNIWILNFLKLGYQMVYDSNSGCVPQKGAQLKGIGRRLGLGKIQSDF